MHFLGCHCWSYSRRFTNQAGCARSLEVGSIAGLDRRWPGHVIKVGGAAHERKKWLRCPQSATATGVAIMTWIDVAAGRVKVEHDDAAMLVRIELEVRRLVCKGVSGNSGGLHHQ